MNQLFDKYIDILFYDQMPSQNGALPTPIDGISTPELGIKQAINLSATFLPSDVMSSVEVRITNYYPSVPLSTYKWMTVQAGYKHSDDSAFIEGQVMVAYQESPSPDGVTLVSLLIGHVEDVLNREIDIFIPETSGTNEVVFNSVVGALSATGNNWALKNSSTSQPVGASYQFHGKVIDCLNDMKNRWKFAFLIEGLNLIVYDPKTGRTGEDVIIVNYLSSPPQAAASGITFVAPWLPKLRPGMVVQINPVFFKQTFGAANVTYQKDGLMITQTVSLQYNTVTQQNQMTVLALNTYEVPQASGS